MNAAGAAVSLTLLTLLLLSPTALCLGFKCPGMDVDQCPSNRPQMTFFDGCNLVHCHGYRSASIQRLRGYTCQPPQGEEQLAECQKLKARLELMQSSPPSSTVDCGAKYSLESLCRYTTYSSIILKIGCSSNFCEGNRLRPMSADDKCMPDLRPQEKLYCEIEEQRTVNSISGGSCAEARQLAGRVCDSAPQYFEFNDGCHKFVCDSGQALMITKESDCRVDAAESPRCRQIVENLRELISDRPPVKCDGTDASEVCKPSMSGFVYKDGCSAILCEGQKSAFSRIPRLCFPEVGERAVATCQRVRRELKEKMASSRSRQEPCRYSDRICVSAGISYYDGCDYCTCTDKGVARCSRSRCKRFYGTDAEYSRFCNAGVYTI